MEKPNHKENTSRYGQRKQKLEDLPLACKLDEKEMLADQGGESSTKQAEAWLHALSSSNGIT